MLGRSLELLPRHKTQLARLRGAIFFACRSTPAELAGGSSGILRQGLRRGLRCGAGDIEELADVAMDAVSRGTGDHGRQLRLASCSTHRASLRVAENNRKFSCS